MSPAYRVRKGEIWRVSKKPTKKNGGGALAGRYPRRN